MLKTLRALRLFNHILLGLVLLILTGAFWNNGTTLLKATKQWWLRRITRLLGMEIEILGNFPERQDTGLLFVSNHVSWLDIPVIGGLTRLNFLSKAEVRQWPLLGRLAQTTGTLFIQRGSGDSDRVAKQIADYLAEGRSVLFFPEGTTSDGSRLGRFHPKLFRTCEHIETSVCPVVIHYQVDGSEHNPVAFVGDDEFTSHLWQLLDHSRIRVTVAVLPARTVSASALDADIRAIRSEMAAQLRCCRHNKISTSAQWPDASSHGDPQDGATSF